MMLQKILVPLDGSKLAERALPYAKAILAGKGGEVVLFTVASLAAAGKEPDQPLIPFIGSYLDSIARDLESQKIKVSTAIGQGDAADQIIDHAGAKDIDLIVICTHGYSGVRRWAVGSVAYKVLQGCCNPILLIKSRALEVSQVQLKKILLPLDGSAFSEAAIPLAEELAAGTRADIILARVSPHPLDVPYTRPIDERSWPAYLKQLTQEMEQQAKEYITRIESSFAKKGIKVQPRVFLGKPAEKLLEIADGEKVDLIVMSTHGHSGVSRWNYGNVAARITQESLQPVLLVRPCPPTSR